MECTNITFSIISLFHTVHNLGKCYNSLTGFYADLIGNFAANYKSIFVTVFNLSYMDNGRQGPAV